MSVFGMLAAEVQFNPLDPVMWTIDSLVGGGQRSTAGQTVNADNAMQLAVYAACVRNISEDIAKLPLHVYRRLDPRGKERAQEHPLYKILHDAPNPETTSFSFRETLQAHALTWGNGYAEIERNALGQPIALWPIHPGRVCCYREDGEVYYRIRNNDGTHTDFPQRNFFHIHGLGGDALCGYSVIRAASEAVGLGIATQKFSAAFFGNGAHHGLALVHPARLKPEAQAELRDSWIRQHGGADNAHGVTVLHSGIKLERTTVAPEEAQMLESRQFSNAEICRFFRMPLHKIQELEGTNFASIEHLSIEYVGDTLMPWCVRWESEIARKLFGTEERTYFAEHLLAGLLRGDMAARAAYFLTRFNIGSLSPDDIREIENENPIPGDAGKKYYMQVNMTTLDKIASAPAPSTATSNTANSASTVTVDAPGPEARSVTLPVDVKITDLREFSAQTIAAMRGPLLEAAQRVIRKEVMALSGKRDAARHNKFFSEQGAYLFQAVAPSVQALCQMTGREYAPERLQRLCNALTEIRRLTSQGLQDFTKYVSEYPAAIVDAVISEMTGE